MRDIQGAPRKRKKVACEVSNYFFWELRRFSRDFFYRVFDSPCYETPKNAIKKNRTKQPGKRKKKRTKKTQIFCDEPRWIFSGIFFFRVFELPLLLVTKHPKSALKKIDETNKNKNKNKIEQVTTFFFCAEANVRHFRPFFFAAPLGL
jgi:hypothetical protein